MTRVYRILGVPGGGKSTRLLGDEEEDVRGYVDEFLEKGYDLDDFRFVSFSRSHASELRRDVKQEWPNKVGPMDDDELEEMKETVHDHVTTLHSLCRRLLRIDPENIICTEYESCHDIYESFWFSRGVPFDANTTDPLQMVRNDEDADLSPAERLVALDQILTLRGDGYSEGVSLSVEAVADSPVDLDDMHPETAVELIEEWRSFKQEQDLYEHHDYIREVAVEARTPRCDVMLIDEMQDYAPLEYAVIREWIDSGSIDHIVISGDPQQSIYGFKLADSRYLVSREVDDEEVLDESYRCPERVCDVARSIRPQSEITSATRRRGTVDELSVPDDESMADLVRRLLRTHEPNDDEYDPFTPGWEVSDPTTVMILARTNRQVGQVMRALQREGVPFTGIADKLETSDESEEVEYEPWTNDVIRICRAFRSLKNRTGRVEHEYAEAVLERAPNPEERMEMAESPFDSLEASGGSAIDLWTAFPEADSTGDILDRLALNRGEQQMVEGAMRTSVELRPARVQVGTVHEAKGQQSPAVVVLDDYPDTLADQYHHDTEFREEEQRIAYTAVSRASETLVVARDFLKSSRWPPLTDLNTTDSHNKGVIYND